MIVHTYELVYILALPYPMVKYIKSLKNAPNQEQWLQWKDFEKNIDSFLPLLNNLILIYL